MSLSGTQTHLLQNPICLISEKESDLAEIYEMKWNNEIQDVCTEESRKTMVTHWTNSFASLEKKYEFIFNEIKPLTFV